MFDAKKYGPWAVICGASLGMGESYARKLGQAGLDLVLIARQQPVLEQLAETVRQESEVLQWLLGWGRHARVLEPEALRRRIAEEAEALACIYRDVTVR